MLDNIFKAGTMTFGNVLLSLGLALVLGILAALYYTRKNMATRSFALTVAILPLITASVISWWSTGTWAPVSPWRDPSA